jgi:hypothetical protein
MHDSVPDDFKAEVVILFLGGQDPVNEKVSGFKMIGFEGQLLDRVPSEPMISGPYEPNVYASGFPNL